MNSFNQAASGLTSSLFLAVGLTCLAEKTDPMLRQNAAALTQLHEATSGRFCEFPCNFTPQSGQ